MSTTIQDVLARLDLGLDADERAIKRAYARRLKRIDQETDLAGFQSLREDYETALNWARYQGQMAAAQAAEEAATSSEEAETPPENPPPPQAATAEPLPPSTDTENPQEAEPTPDVLAHAVFLACIAALQLPTLKDRHRAGQVLDASLADPRLIHIDALAYFEWFMANALADGWRPGHEVLFVVCAERFDWFHDSQRLIRFGQVGRFINSALQERLSYDQQGSEQREKQRQSILQLRGTEHPGDVRVIQNRPHLEQLVQAYPHWLRIIAPVSHLELWRQWDQAIPDWKRRLTPKGKAPLLTQPQTVQKPVRKFAGWGFMALMVLIQLGKLVNHTSSPAPHEAPDFRPQPTSTAERDTDWQKPAALPLNALDPLAPRPPPSGNLFPDQPQFTSGPAKPKARPSPPPAEVKRQDEVAAAPRTVPLDVHPHTDFAQPMLVTMPTRAPQQTPVPAPPERPSPRPDQSSQVDPTMPPVDYSLKPTP